MVFKRPERSWTHACKGFDLSAGLFTAEHEAPPELPCELGLEGPTLIARGRGDARTSGDQGERSPPEKPRKLSSPPPVLRPELAGTRELAHHLTHSLLCLSSRFPLTVPS